MNGTGSQQGISQNGRKDSAKGLRRTDFNDPRIGTYETNGMNGSAGGSLRGVIGQRSLQGSGVRKSLVSVGNDSQHNPYSAYDFGDSLDDGIHSDLTSHHGENNGVQTSDQIPPEDEILREFADYMEVMSPMSEPEEVALKNTNTEEKWRLICNQRQRSPIFPIRHYIENLRQNQGTRRKKFPSLGKSTKGTSALSYALKKLKVDLKMSPPAFLEEFSEPPNGGVHLLVQLLRTLQTDQNAINTGRASRMDEFKKILEDEADCLLALKFLTRTEECLQKLSRQEGVYDLIIQSTLSTRSKCRAVALQLLSLLCGASNSGYQQLMAALGRQRQKLADPALFTTLCTSINTADVNNDLTFIVSAVRLFNTLISTVSNANASVYLQYELERAGFNPDHLEKLSYGNTIDHEDLSGELEVWRRQYVDVTTTREAVAGLESRNALLRAEVTRLQEQLKAVERSTKQIEREKRKMSEKRDDYRERAAELQDTVAKLTKLYADSTGKMAGQAVNVEEVLKPLDTPPADMYASVRSVSSVTSDVPKAPPLPPPAPPLLPPSKRKLTSSTVELPLLNWTPIHTVTNTIFQDLHDERLYKELDFADFESRFKLQRRPETAETRERRERMARRQQADKLYFVNPNRAKNMCITKHRTGLTSRQIREAVEHCDVTTLPGEYAELFIKFIPTKEELKLLAKHREEYWNMGEAEQFLFQLAQVERLESKLSLLAFVGVFDELLLSVKPNITQVLEASNYVQHNEGLKRIFEIILAFGNYMNGAKRGYTMGFKLESLYKLSDVKTIDKQQTLLHYLAEQVHAKYPELLSLLDDSRLRVPKGASYHAMLNDVKGLRKGLDLVNFEKEKQPKNAVLERFYSSSSLEVAGVAESFKRMEEAYKEVCLTLGENYKQIEPDSLFGILADFAASFKKAHHQNLQRSLRPLSASSSRSSLTPSEASLTSSTVTTPGSSRREPELTPGAKKEAPPAPAAKKEAPLAPAPKKEAPPAPAPKKEAPKILVPLTPQHSPRTRVIGNQRKELAKGGSVGPIAAQHNVGMTSPQKDVTSPEKGGSVKKRAAPSPPALNVPVSEKAVVNGPTKVANGVVADHKGVKDADPVKRPLSVEIPDRPRTFSEPSTADVMSAINTIDQIVDYEEKFGGLPEEETFTSYL